MLPEVKARPSLAIEFVNAWRALPTTMNDKQRAAQAAKMMAAHDVKLSAATALAFKDHLALLFGDDAFQSSATPSSDAAAKEAGGQSKGHPPAGPAAMASDFLLRPPEVCPFASSHGEGAHALHVYELKGQKRVFTMSGVRTTTALAAHCSCGCWLYNTEYKTPEGTRHYYPDATERAYFQSSRQSAFERTLLLWLGVLLERSQVAFDGFAVAYAGLLRSAGLPGAYEHVGELRPFDRRLAEAAWMQHELLCAQREAGRPLSTPMSVRGDALRDTLATEVPELHAAFVRKWAVEHTKRCTRPGRCNCLTFDADAKTCRDVCQCRVGNELVLQGHGMVEIGCTESPMQGSSMCAQHTKRAGLPHEVQCEPCQDEDAVAEEKEEVQEAVVDAAQDAARGDGARAVESSDSESSDSEEGPESAEGASEKVQAASAVPPAKLLRCGTCWRFTKKFPRSRCVECPGKRIGGDPGAAQRAPVENEAPALVPEELRTRLVARNVPNGEAYSLRRVVAKHLAEVDDSAAPKRIAGREPDLGPKKPKPHAGKKTQADDANCDGGEREVEEQDDDHGNAMKRPALPKGMYAVEEVLECREVLGARAFLVKWEGYPLWQASWEIEDDLTTACLDEYWERSEREGVTRLAPTRPVLRTDVISLDPSAAEQRALERMRCGTFKWKQKGTPAGGYLRRTKGVLMAVRSCNIIVGYAECFGSESISQVVFFLLQLFELCPGMLDELTILCYDDMCHLKRYLQKKVERGGAHANPWYVKMLSMLMCVDKLHIKGHKVVKNGKRTFCGRECDPRRNPFKAALADQNTESSEQTFRWFSRFKVLLRPMTKANFNFVTLRMMERHNTRIIEEAAAAAARKK